MNDQHKWQLNKHKEELQRGREMAYSAQRKIDALIKQSAEASGIHIGSVVSNAKRGKKMSVTSFSLAYLDGVGDIVTAHGVPLTKDGKPMKRRDSFSLGAVEKLVIEEV